MEETHDTQKTPEQPTGDTQAPRDDTVTLTVTLHGEATSSTLRFNTPALLERVKSLDDEAMVRISAEAPGTPGGRTLLEGTKEQAITALSASVVPADKIALHLREMVKMLISHSTLKAVGVSAVCSDADNNDAGFGFVITSSDCTTGAAVALVNCSDANMDEFIAKAKLSIPGRTGSATAGVIAPTTEQVKELG